MLPSIAGTILIVACTIHLVYLLFFFRRAIPLKGNETTAATAPKPFVSVIICARNEEQNLRQNLPSVLAQRYYNDAAKIQYEVLVVNDASTDGSADYVNELTAVYPHLKIITILPNEERILKGKKFALQKGIANACGKILLFTDADCSPASDEWILLMTAPFANGKKIVAGFGAYRQEAGLLNAFTRWETLHTFMQYAGYAKAGTPYMAVGRNLACTKETAQGAQHSPHWNEIPSGDDDLLINAMATSTNMDIVAMAKSTTISEPKHTWAAWFRQKQRHVSTGKYYKPSVIYLLSLYAYSHAAIWVCTIWLCCTGFSILPILFLGVRCLCYWGLWHRLSHRLKQPILPFYLPVMDIGWFLYNFLLSPYIILRNRQLWK